MRREQSAARTAMKKLHDALVGPQAAATGSNPPRDRSPRSKLANLVGSLGIKVKLPVAFAAVSIMTLAAAGVAITSFSASEQSVQNVATREVPLMTDALRLSAISGEISAAAARLVNAKTADEQKAIATRIRERYEAFNAMLDHMRQTRKDAAFATVELPAQSLGVNLKALASAIEDRSTLRSRLETKLDALNRSHARVGDKLTPIVDDSYFDVVTTAEAVGKTADKIVKSLVDDGLQVMQVIVDIGAETNLVTGLLTAGTLTSSPSILALLEDRFTSSALRVQSRLAKLPQNQKFDDLRKRVAEIVQLADFKAGTAGDEDMARLQNVFRVHESLAGVLVTLVDDLNFDLVTQSDDAIKKSSKVVKDLVTNQIAALRDALDIAAQTHLVASVLNETSVAKDAAMLIPFQEKFKASSDSLVKLSATLHDEEIRKAIADLLAFGRGDESVSLLRGKELAAALRADQTIEENAKIQLELDRAVSNLVSESEHRMNQGIGQLTDKLDHDRILLIVVAGLSLLASGVIAVFY
jgi:phosphoglycerate-specific signal transduction histidine kinase